MADGAVVVDPLEAVLAHVTETVDAEALHQEIDRPPAHDRDHADERHERPQCVDRLRQRDRVGRIVDDR